MRSPMLHLLPLLLLSIAGVSLGGDAPGAILISCGGSGSGVNADGRSWVGDMTPGENFTLRGPAGVSASAPAGDGTAFGPLYKTARFFTSPAAYSFTAVSPGMHCLRLHFFPFAYSGLNASESAFDADAGELRLLSKFNVSEEIYWRSLVSNAGNVGFLVKEFFIPVFSGELRLSFAPRPGSFAFVNAIELIPSPASLFNATFKKVGSGGGAPVDLAGRGLETMYRLNVGGPAIGSPEDAASLSRTWEPDERFMFSVNAGTAISNTSNISYAGAGGAAAAPLAVYETARSMSNSEVGEKRFNMTWRFAVPPGFDYAVRLHFCELVFDRPSQRIFNIYINNRTAAESYDVAAAASGMGRAYADDYVDSLGPKLDSLWLQLGPDTMAGAAGADDALLNGLEIFKISRNGNLASVLEIDIAGDGHHSSRRKEMWEFVGIGFAALMSVAAAGVFLWQHFLRSKNDAPPPGWHPLFLHELIKSSTDARAAAAAAAPPPPPPRTGRRFTLPEMKAATRNFDEALVIGVGGFGKVYRGELAVAVDGTAAVAVKRASRHCDQGLREFETEIELLSKLRHRHLVALIGYCDDPPEMILVYEFMSRGTLRSNIPAMPWRQRVEACIGAGRGLHYLHTGAGVIHRDVKTTNILLGEDLVAKVSDFGLSRAGPSVDETHVSTAVKGSFGYLDPEYFRRQQLTEKSDVYSFGVVLFEVACGRSVVDPSLPKDQINLAEWALRWQRQRSLETIVDPALRGDCSPESLRKFGEIAEKCLADDGRSRPTMGEVLWHLEYALQLHEAYADGGGDGEELGSIFIDDTTCH